MVKGLAAAKGKTETGKKLWPPEFKIVKMPERDTVAARKGA
jgi:hypothetical protein